jgi:hypothetical protein
MKNPPATGYTLRYKAPRFASVGCVAGWVNSVPEGPHESSPALQCRVAFFKDDTSRMGRSMAACEVKLRAFLSSLIGRACLLRDFPAVNCWATFIRSLWDETSLRTLKTCVDVYPRRTEPVVGS